MLALPDDLLQSLSVSEDELRQEIAVLLYRKGLPPGKAASFAGMDRFAFRHLLASRHIPVQYDVADLDADVRTLDALLGDQNDEAT